MKTTLEQIRVVGNTFVATSKMESLRIKKSFKNGGGILGGCIKAGDRIKVIGACYDIDSISFSTDVTLHRLSQSFFLNNEYLIKE